MAKLCELGPGVHDLGHALTPGKTETKSVHCSATQCRRGYGGGAEPLHVYQRHRALNLPRSSSGHGCFVTSRGQHRREVIFASQTRYLVVVRPRPQTDLAIQTRYSTEVEPWLPILVSHVVIFLCFHGV